MVAAQHFCLLSVHVMNLPICLHRVTNVWISGNTSVKMLYLAIQFISYHLRIGA